MTPPPSTAPPPRPTASPATGLVNGTVPRPRAAPDAAQPAHRDLHADHAAGVLPHVRHGGQYRTQSVGNGNVTAFVMVSMAVYGAMLATTSGGAMVSIERAQGWSRQLRLTPLRPTAYIAIKVLVAMVLGLVAVVVVAFVGAGQRRDGRRRRARRVARRSRWLGSLVFAAFGLFMGYLLPARTSCRSSARCWPCWPSPAGCSCRSATGSFADIAKLTPVYGLAELARAPLTGEAPSIWAVVNVVVWAAVFVGGAAWLFRRDTARV